MLGWLCACPALARAADALPSTPPPTPPPLRLRSAAQSGANVKYALDTPAQPGICAEIAAAVQRADAGLLISGLTQPVPLRRLELMLSKNEIDVFFCMLQSARRRQLMRFLPVPLYKVRHVLALRLDDGRAPVGWDELRAFARRKPVLVAQGSQLALTLQQADVAYTEAARSDHDALQMLLRGRTDAVYGQDMSLRRALREAGLEGRVRLSNQVYEEEVQYAVVSRELPDAVVERLTERLRQLGASGELGRIVDRYR